MKKNLLQAGGLLFLVWIGHLVSRKNAYYGTYFFADIILHIVAGVAFALIWIALAGRPTKKSDYVSIILFAVFGSYLWELWELSGLKIIPDKIIYKPTLSDSLGDIACGTFGALLVSGYLYLKKTK